ncbi:FMN-binding protein [Streptomyces sp. MMG1121]|uniref:FMN-binding protein n=1 Tax=Streptomyces sp. MMG1121 TaxID=1415544 RepID=UPI0006ADE4B8|nr:FMN-binding protein [Streptomyces sp. MMG1121]KOV65770.1 FMN-binding protein [Streptomyces sp. MMG1121]
MRKSHPLRRIVLATAATVSGVVLLLSLKPASGPASAAAGTAPQQTAAGQESPQGGTRPAGAATGTVTGDATQTQYGTVQVRLTVAGGRITQAQAVQAPKGGLSDQKTAMAVPRLNQEAVAAQSARIDAVSGATYTSNGYKKSLQSALDRMKPSAGSSAGTPSASSSGSTAGSSAGSSSSGAAQARTVTGKVAQTPYGPVQVRITVKAGKVVQASAVQAPKGGLSDQKTAMAVPKLNQEAVAAGNASIDAVSGATYTSTGYRQSLQSALDQAGG